MSRLSNLKNQGLPYAEERYGAVPINLKEHYCKCKEPKMVPYISWMRREENGDEERKDLFERYPDSPSEITNRISPLGLYCTDCLKPGKYTLSFAYRVCEECGTYYVPDPRPYTYPIRTFLCSKHFRPSRQMVVRMKNFPDYYTVIDKMKKESDFYERGRTINR